MEQDKKYFTKTTTALEKLQANITLLQECVQTSNREKALLNSNLMELKQKIQEKANDVSRIIQLLNQEEK